MELIRSAIPAPSAEHEHEDPCPRFRLRHSRGGIHRCGASPRRATRWAVRPSMSPRPNIQIEHRQCYCIPNSKGKIMADILVRRDQFNITPQCIVHKPTDAAFTPQPGNRHAGNMRLGCLENAPPSGDKYRPEHVRIMMEQLWAEYVATNPDAFR
jgi:hypothetical protein